MSVLPRVSLIVVNWNGRAYLEGCLTSLLALDYPAFSVTVVDNASTDGSPDFVRERFPQVELIRSSHNLGYGGGANLALRTCPADVAVDPEYRHHCAAGLAGASDGADDGRPGDRNRRVQTVLSRRPNHSACGRIHHSAPGLARPLWLER